MVPLIMPLASQIPVVIVSHDQKSHVAPHFSCLNLRNAVVPFTMPSTSCDIHTSSSIVT